MVGLGCRLTAALTIVDRGGRVVLLDKNKYTGGNSAYASSGINAIDPADPAEGDSFEVG
jgi:succinate dehydrogenase/fumarate reductase flavoprotein subunit